MKERFSLHTLPLSQFFQHPLVLKFPLLSPANFYLPRATRFADSCHLHVPFAEHQAAGRPRGSLRTGSLLAFQDLACSVEKRASLLLKPTPYGITDVFLTQRNLLIVCS